MADSTTSEPEQHVPGGSRPLRVLIVGGGIAGLTLGIVLRKNGHEVQIFEQSRFAQELGAAVHMAPNAHGLFKTLGIDLAATGANEVQWIREYAPSGEINREIPASKVNAIWQHSWMLAHRVRIHNALKKAAIDPEGIGRPCDLHLASPISSVDAQTATVTLEDGTTIRGDVVVGADGVHSKTRRLVPGGAESRPFGSGKNGFRFMIQRDKARTDARTKGLCDQDGIFAVVIGSDRRIVMYPTSNNTLLNFLCIHPESASEAGEDWNTSTNLEALLKVYVDFAPEFTAILSKAEPESLKLWKLWDMENLPVWNYSRLALIGDAAHPFLPHQGQGAAMAMEDAVALGTVLEKGLTADEVPGRLKLYNDIRYDRACKIQQYTRLAGLDVQDGKLDTIEYAKYNFGHDEFHNSAQRLREWKWKQLPKAVFRMPVGFGPDSSMASQTGKPSTSPTFRTTTVRFMTSRTLIKNFFPPETAHFTFDSPGTLAACSFVQTTFRQVGWLSNQSYNTLALYVYGVSYHGSEKQKIAGTYIPVIFEDLPHAIIRDREAYGLPAVYGQLNVKQDSNDITITASFDGKDWANIVIHRLQPENAQISQTTNGVLPPADPAATSLLAWRSMPGLDGEADNFAVQILGTNDNDNMKVQGVWASTDVSIQIGPRDQKLPTIVSDIVERLSEMPIYQILSAKIVEGSGAPSFNRARRLT